MKEHQMSVLKFKAGKKTSLVEKAILKFGSQRKLSLATGIPKGCISSYLSENYLIPSHRFDTFLRILNLTKEDILNDIQQELPTYWGQKQAARQFLSKLSHEELQNRMAHTRTFKKEQLYTLDFPLTSQLCEFYGILIGDGCLSIFNDYDNTERHDIVITGDKRYEREYYSYIRSLLNKHFDTNCFISESNVDNSMRLLVRNKSLAYFLLRLGYLPGKKAKIVSIPPRLLSLEWPLLKNVVRGIFDTDGTIFANKTEDYRYPYVGICSHSPELLRQLYTLLRNQNYPVYISRCNLFLRGITNVQKWMGDIGTSNPKHKFKYDYWVSYGSLPAYLLGR